MFGKKKKKDDDDAGEEGQDENGAEGAEGAEEGAEGGSGNSQEESGVGNMRRGDYMIHVLVEKAKDIKVPDGDTVDPLVEVTCLGQKQYTSAKDDIGGLGEVVYNEHLFLEPKNVEQQDAEQATITIKLMDKGLFSQTLIGMFEFDLSQIYFMKDHTLLHQMIALYNPESEEYATVFGYLKISISVVCTGDEQIQINEDEDTTGANDGNVLMPPQLNPEFYQITVKIFECQDLPAMDGAVKVLGVGQNAKTDAYIRTYFKKQKLKTRVLVMEEGGDPIRWNQEILLPAQWPLLTKRIVLEVMDEDPLGDETVGSILLDKKKIIEGYYKDKYVWKNIYGSPMNLKNSQAKREMNSNPDIASNWKGRVLLKIDCKKTEKPVAKVLSIKQEEVAKAAIHTKPKDYKVFAEIGQGIALPDEKKYQVRMIIGGHIIETDKSKTFQKKNYNRYNQRFEEIIDKPYVDPHDFGSIIIQLVDDKGKPVCFYRDDISKYTKPDADYKWVSLKPDLAVNKVKNINDAGMLSFKLSLVEGRDTDIAEQEVKERKRKEKEGLIKGPRGKTDSWKQKLSKRAHTVNIRAYIYQCRDLPAADSNGTSDPFVTVWDMSDKKKKTQIIDDSTNPLFYKVIDMEYEVRDETDVYSYPPFILDVFDHDDALFDNDPDYLARAIIEPEDCGESLMLLTVDCEEHQQKGCRQCFKDKEIPNEPKWHPLRFAEGEPVSGEILVSFAVADTEYMYIPDPSLRDRIDFQEFDVNMLILGLRQLESPGILPVKKAFIQFNIKSLVPPGETAIQNIKTAPKAPGPNPTINTTMKFQIPLPTKDLYCPKLSCAVYDYIFKGWNQPMIGVFTLDIGKLMNDLKDERREETQIIRSINEKLRTIAEAPENQIPNYGGPSINEGQQQMDLGSEIYEEMETEISRKDSRVGKHKREESEIDSSGQISKKKRSRSKNADVKKAKKSLQGSIMEGQVNKNLGASEQDGIQIAEEARQSKLEAIRKRRESARQSSAVESDAQMGLAMMSPAMKKKKAALQKDMEKEVKKTKKEQLEEQKWLVEQEKDIQNDERKRAQEELIAQGRDITQCVLMPEFTLDNRLKVDREINMPHKSMYIGLGWDEDRNTKRKHYRQYYQDELEKCKDVFPQESPFNTEKIIRGQSRGIAKSGGLMGMFKSQKKTDESGQVSTLQTVGFFKGIVEIESKQEKEAYSKNKEKLIKELIDLLQKISRAKTGQNFEFDRESIGTSVGRRKFELDLRRLDVADMDIPKHLANLDSDEILKRQLLAQTKCQVTVYMIEAYNLASRDNGSPSDPYLYLTCNGKVYNERDNYQLDEPNPKFLKKYDFEGTFPGCSPLKIDVYDYDDIFGDDLIGTSTLDLEDRFFCMDWQSLEDKPIEHRDLYHECSSLSQGVVKMWCEINPLAYLKDVKVWDISEKPPMEFEVRICVFNAVEIPMMDAEGTSDVFFRTFFDSKEEVQETDTHFRNQDGKPDFQYRLIYRIKVPRKDYKLSVQAYDRDFFKSNDMIGEASINLRDLLEDCSLVKKPLGLNKSYYNDVLKPKQFQKIEFDEKDESKFWVPMKCKIKGKIEEQGKVKMQIDVLPADQADKNPLGKARQEPNHSPFLPQPEGRFELSLNPIKMFNQLVGPEIRRKIYLGLVCAICIVLLVAMAPMIISNLISGWIADLFKK